ncbi:MAG: ABC transporter permease [bacterium]|nr:ABC transporter permease [bacterium]
MLKIKDSALLALTKFKIRRVRLGLSVVFIAILCAAVITAYLGLEKSTESLEKVTSRGLSGRYIAMMAYKNEKAFEIISNPPQEILAKAKNLYTEENRCLAQEARKKGEEFIPNPAESPIEVYDDGFEKTESLNLSSKIANNVLAEYLRQNFPKTSEDFIKKKLAQYPVKSVFESKTLTLGGKMIEVKDSKENLAESVKNGSGGRADSFFSQMSLQNDELAKIFYNDNYVLEKDEVPALVNYDFAAHLLGEKPIADSAPPRQKYEYIQKLRSKINSHAFEFCWRNNQADFDNMRRAFIANRSSDSKIKYEIAKTPCGDSKAIKDTRTREEKILQDKQDAEMKKLPEYIAPDKQIIKLRVIGLFPTGRTPSIGGLEGLFYQMLSSTIGAGGGIMIPQNALTQNTNQRIHDIINPPNVNSPIKNSYLGEVAVDKMHLVEFSNAQDLSKFVSETNCAKNYCGKEFSMAVQEMPNNATVIAEIKSSVQNVLNWIIAGVAVLTAIIIYVVVNRIMVDSRRETAVFRAIGYSRLEITQIYIAYVAIYSLIVTVLATILSLLVVIWISGDVQESASLEISAMFSLKNIETFKIVEFTPVILLSFLPIFAVGLGASLLPLLLNARRSPLKNLRLE